MEYTGCLYIVIGVCIVREIFEYLFVFVFKIECIYVVLFSDGINMYKVYRCEFKYLLVDVYV